MIHGSLFSGIGGFDLGFERAGIATAWQVEQEHFCRAVLASHWPGVRRFADVRKVGSRNLEKVDCITAGVPCQDVSVAGKRAGLAGKRTGLFYEFARILRELRPAWFVFENVPGLLSSNHGRDFAEILRVLMAECGYGVSWRVLDSQFFGVAQRRRRVFLAGRLGKPCPPEILFDAEGGGGDSAPRGETRKSIAVPLTSGSGVTGKRPGRREDDFNIVQVIEQNTQCSIPKLPSQRSHGTPNYAIASPITASAGHHGHSSERGDGCDNLVAATLNSSGNDGGFRTEPGEHIVIQDVRGHREKREHGIGIPEGGPSYTLSETERHAVAFAENQRGELRTSKISPPLSCSGGKPGSGYPAALCAAADADGMRDFAGLPEGLDSARYRALGNAVTVQVAEWIARRIKMSLNGSGE
jgi:DNA (cytosine-5)-methyltransferase 1